MRAIPLWRPAVTLAQAEGSVTLADRECLAATARRRKAAPSAMRAREVAASPDSSLLRLNEKGLPVGHVALRLVVDVRFAAPRVTPLDARRR